MTWRGFRCGVGAVARPCACADRGVRLDRRERAVCVTGVVTFVPVNPRDRGVWQMKSSQAGSHPQPGCSLIVSRGSGSE
jgi:hypothetical protein